LLSATDKDPEEIIVASKQQSMQVNGNSKDRSIRSRGSNIMNNSSKMQQSSGEDQGSGVLSIYEVQSEPVGVDKIGTTSD
jgi:hypothetical protein